MKQSSRLWYKRLAEFLFTKLGFYRLYADHSIFVTTEGVRDPIITTFVNDFNIFAPPRSGVIQRIKKELAAAFDMVDMGPLAFYVCLKIIHDRIQKTIKLLHPGYIEKMLDHTDC